MTKISKVLHDAADKYLAASIVELEKCKYSCGAVAASCQRNNVDFKIVKVGLRNMGCDTASLYCFFKYGDEPRSAFVNKEVQGMRYFWLKWAALMAEEQGM